MPNDGKIVANAGRKKAHTKDRSLVPEGIQKRLLEKRRGVPATVEVERIGNSARKRAQEEERRKAAFEAMSPEERDIALLSHPGVTEDQVVQLYMRLDQFSEPNRKPLATALKGYWLRVGKWAKVQKIKGILDEN